MPHRALVARQLSGLFSVLAHPVRLQIVVELRNGELSVHALQDILGIRQSAVSQHLALLKLHNLIKERRHGRQVMYRLSNPDIAPWIVQGIPLILPDATDSRVLKSAAQRAVSQWSEVSMSDSTEEDKLISLVNSL